MLVHEIWHFGQEREMATPCQGDLCFYCTGDDTPVEATVTPDNLYPYVTINREPAVGAQVLVRSNEDEPFQTGYMYGFQTMGRSEEKFPVVVMHHNKVPMLCMGIVVEDNEYLRWVLEKMDPKEQWNFLSLHYKR